MRVLIIICLFACSTLNSGPVLGCNKTEDQRKRANVGSPGIGQQRYELYKTGFEKIRVAMQQGYFLEAICIIESLLADRMESRLGEFDPSFTGFINLMPLVKQLRRYEKDIYLNYVLNDIAAWSSDRNKIHEIMKLDSNNLQTWDQKQKRLGEIATEGLRLLRNYDNGLRRSRKKRY